MRKDLILRLTAAILLLTERAQADYLYRTTFSASNPQGNDDFGSSVTLVLNGSSSLIMASGVPNVAQKPHVEIFRSANNGLSWSFTQEIICCPTPPNQVHVPFAVAFSDNGGSVLIGKPGSAGPDPNVIGATLYINNNGQYIDALVDLTNSNVPTNGMSVALSGDGNWAFVGAVTTVSYTNIPSALCKGLVLPTPNNSPFSLATNSDGSTLIIGTGANVLVYTAYSFQTSSITQTILPQLGETTTFGLSVSLTRDGSILAIGSCGFGVYIYQMTNLTTPSQIITSPDASTNFGCNVDISDDGRKLIVGSQNAGAVSNGYAYPFRSNGGFFSLEGSKIAPPVFNVSYGGGGVAVVNEALDYAIVLVGGPTASTGPSGAISVFDSVPTSSATPTATASATSSFSALASNSATYSAVPSASATSTMTSTSSATATSTTSPSSTTTPSPSSQPINSLAANSALIGVTAGVAISGSLVGTVLGYFVIQWLRQRFSSSQQQSPSNEFSSLSTSISSQKSTLLYSSSLQGGSNMYSS